MILFAVLLAASASTLQPSDFGFAHVGATTPAEAVARAKAPPDVEYDAWTVRGRVDWFIAAPSEERLDRLASEARSSKKTLEKVHVLEWDDPEDPERSARLVFDGGVLWYALLPVSASEGTPQQVADRVGHPATEIVPISPSGDLQSAMRVYGWRDQGVAYVALPGPRFVAKALVPR